MHEIIHSISKLQPLKQKKKLSDRFLSQCNFDFKKIKKYLILEEPLSVILGQMYYQEQYQPKRFKYDQNWYNKKWINFFAKVYYPVVKEHFASGKAIDVELMNRLSKLCIEFKHVAGHVD